MMLRRALLWFTLSWGAPLVWAAPVSTWIFVDGVDYSDQLRLSREGALYRFQGTIHGPGFRLGADFLINPDPFVDYGLEYISDDCPGGNCLIVPPNIVTVVEFEDGPWSGLYSSFYMFVRDANNDGRVGATGMLPGGRMMYTSVDGALRHQLGNGCVFQDVAPGFSSVCDDETWYSVIPATGTDGLLMLQISFLPSFGDAFSFRGTAALVPEPATWSLMLLAVVPLLARRRR
jgi:hypothetical protein